MAHQQMTNQLTLFRHGSFQRLLIHSSIQKWHPNLEFGKEIEASKPESVESENVNMWNLAKIFENNVDIVTMPQEIAQMTTGNFTSIIRRLVTYYTMQNQNRNIALCKVTNYPCKVTTKCYTVQNNQSVNLLFEAFPSCPARFRDACKQVALRSSETHAKCALSCSALRSSETHTKCTFPKLFCAGQKCSVCAKTTVGSVIHCIPHIVL